MPEQHIIHLLKHKLCTCWVFKHCKHSVPLLKSRTCLAKKIEGIFEIQTHRYHVEKRIAEVISLSLISSQTSIDVCQYLWECFGDHPASVLGDSPVPHPDVEGPRVYPLSPDPQPASPKAGGVFPACVVLHQWHWHECCEYLPTNQCWCLSTPCLLMSVRE